MGGGKAEGGASEDGETTDEAFGAGHVEERRAEAF